MFTDIITLYPSERLLVSGGFRARAASDKPERRRRAFLHPDRNTESVPEPRGMLTVYGISRRLPGTGVCSYARIVLAKPAHCRITVLSAVMTFHDARAPVFHPDA